MNHALSTFVINPLVHIHQNEKIAAKSHLCKRAFKCARTVKLKSLYKLVETSQIRRCSIYKKKHLFSFTFWGSARLCVIMISRETMKQSPWVQSHCGRTWIPYVTRSQTKIIFQMTRYAILCRQPSKLFFFSLRADKFASVENMFYAALDISLLTKNLLFICTRCCIPHQICVAFLFGRTIIYVTMKHSGPAINYLIFTDNQLTMM